MDDNLKMDYYYTDDIWIRVDLSDADMRGKRFIGVTYSPELMRRIQELEKQSVELYRANQHLDISLALAGEERKRNHALILERMNDIFQDNTEAYYIPAGRSLLTVMAGNRAVMSGIPNPDLITDRFLLLIDTVREKFSDGISNAYHFFPDAAGTFDVEKIAENIIDILKGEYFYAKGEELLKVKGSRQAVKINFISSGQQEILWLLNFLYILLLRKEKSFVVIEEPEAHIYPLQQKKVIEFIILFANLSGSRVFITTHSPYLLTVANNYFYAGNIRKSGNGQAVGKAVPENLIIDADSVSAYKLLPPDQNNTQKAYEKLLEEDGMEIRADMIDEVSETVNELYTTLYGIELEQDGI